MKIIMNATKEDLAKYPLRIAETKHIIDGEMEKGFVTFFPYSDDNPQKYLVVEGIDNALVTRHHYCLIKPELKSKLLALKFFISYLIKL